MFGGVSLRGGELKNEKGDVVAKSVVYAKIKQTDPDDVRANGLPSESNSFYSTRSKKPSPRVFIFMLFSRPTIFLLL